MHLKIHSIWRERTKKTKTTIRKHINDRKKKCQTHTRVYINRNQLPQKRKKKWSNRKKSTSDWTSAKTHMKRTLQETTEIRKKNQTLNTILSRTFWILLVHMCAERKWNWKKNQFGICYENHCFLLLTSSYDQCKPNKNKRKNPFERRKERWFSSRASKCHF